MFMPHHFVLLGSGGNQDQGVDNGDRDKVSFIKRLQTTVHQYNITIHFWTRFILSYLVNEVGGGL